ncbi:unnamed protein product [marine sediment metagenome]|uniref:Uncharacterized protein n=1 Tax=marine sediment metagenome TaxID=412755 RepID=X0UU80_9ZZZZ
MTKLYRLKDRLEREVDDGPGGEVRLRCLKRAGFVVGELPPAPKPKEPVVEEPLPPTEGEDVNGEDQGEPVLAKHAPVGVPLQEVKGAEAETDVVDDESAPEPKAINALVGMNMKELRAVAKEHEITVPFEIKSKVALADFLTEKLPPVEDEETDG